MEFHYSEYLVRITFNPTDIIVRFEQNTTYRAYEQTFFDRDFPEASFLGGLEFVGKVLVAALKEPKSADVHIDGFKKTNTSISFGVAVTNPLFLHPLRFPFELPALRKDSGSLDINVLNRKVKDMSEGFEPRLKQLQEALEGRLAIVDKLTSRITELEDRCGSSITLPGCIFAIPVNLTSLILIRNQTFLPDGRAFTSQYPQSSMGGHPNGRGINWNNVSGHLSNGLSYLTYNLESFTFDKLTSISNLKYLKNCKQITLSGCSELTDYTALGEMTWLTHLTIIQSRAWTGTNPHAAGGNIPPLRDISWVRNLKSLQSLTLLGCASLSDITPLKDLPNLKELDIRETGVRNTDFLINPNLKITK